MASDMFGKLSFDDGGLPSGYRKIEYVENMSNSYQTYIILNHKFNSSHSKLTINYQLPSYTSRDIAGCKDDGSRGKGFNLHDCGYYFGDYFNTFDVKNNMVCVEIGKQSLYVNGEFKQEFTKQIDDTCANNLAIGTTYGSGTTLKAINGYHRIGRVTLEHDDNVLFDLVPCVNPDGFVGFYDVVNEEFRRSESGFDWSEPSAALSLSSENEEV
ncbi:MAG: hypothetical protein MJZ52_07115 [Bacteroidales bacterium]|nr:hypothetical protein [Bacteroidales bacterium]